MNDVQLDCYSLFCLFTIGVIDHAQSNCGRFERVYIDTHYITTDEVISEMIFKDIYNNYYSVDVYQNSVSTNLYEDFSFGEDDQLTIICCHPVSYQNKLVGDSNVCFY